MPGVIEMDKTAVAGMGVALGWIQQAAEVAWVGGEHDPKKKLTRKLVVGLVELSTTMGTIGALLNTEVGEDPFFRTIASFYLISKLVLSPFWMKRKEWTGADSNPEDPTF